jgi:phage gpG-like protein
MIAVSIAGLDVLLDRFGALPQSLARRLDAEVEQLGVMLRDRVERNLSGDVLQRRSGRLAASIAVSVQRSGLALETSVASDAPYAAIHEYGGSIPAREILPRSGRALAFPWRGPQRFFKRVHLPAMRLPQRSFMRSALSAAAPDIRAAIERAAMEAMQA